MERAVRSFPVLLGGLLAARFLIGFAAAAGPPVIMIEPQWQQQRDSQGVSWMIDPQSNLRVNGQSMLMSAGAATINNVQFMPGRAQMRPDGTEYVFEGGNNFNNFNNNPYGPPNGAMPQTLLTVRRIKMDLQSSTVRFVESFKNAGPAPLQVNVTVASTVRSFIQSLVCGPSAIALSAATGQPMTNQAIGGAVPYRVPGGAMVHLAIPDRDCGVVVSGPPGRYPGLLVYAPGSVNVKPSIDIQAMRTIQVSFTVTVPAQSTASVVWGLAQRNLPANPDAAEMKNQLKVFQDRQWLADLPEDVAKSIVNQRRFNSGATSPMGALLQPVLDLASQYHLERGKADVLVQDEVTQLQGTVAGSNLSVETPWGKTSLPLGQVALLCGGDGPDRPMRVYLRNGEILAGRVEAKDLVLKTQAGVEAKLPPEKIHLLFLHAARNDGKPPAEALSILETNDGQRLLLIGSDAQFHAVTPWGGLDVGLGEIDRFCAHRETQPVYRLTLKDGSNLSVLLQGEIPPLKSLRFGPVKLSAAEVRQLWSLAMPVPAKVSTAEEAAGEEAAGSAGPQCRLFGENVLAGTIESPKVNLATAGGVLALPADRIQTAQRSGDPRAGGPMEIQLTDGRRLSGLLSNRTVAIRFHGKVWEVPAQHLIGISGGKKAAAAEGSQSKGASSADAENAAGAAKTDATEEDDAPDLAPPAAKPAPIAPMRPAPALPPGAYFGPTTMPAYAAPAYGAPAPLAPAASPDQPVLETRAPESLIVPTTDNDDDPFQ